MVGTVTEITSPQDISNDGLNLDAIFRAAEGVCPDAETTACDVILRAAAAMPDDASDFDRGMAAGVALARFFDAAKDK